MGWGIVIKNKLLNLFTILWELPQNIVGLFLFVIVSNRIQQKEIIHNRLFLKVSGFGVSLGHFIFWREDVWENIEIRPANKAHEYGHAIQSIIFGPLYLIVIGLPSVSRNLYGRWYLARKKTSWLHYYDGYPEKWADALGKRYFKNE